MKMLLVVDSEEYSVAAAREAVRLATNTWADVTILAMQPSGDAAVAPRFGKALCRYRDMFLQGSSPYGTAGTDRLQRTGDGVWELAPAACGGRKELRVLVRQAAPPDAILQQVREDKSDFLVMGAAREGAAEWSGELRLPQRIAASAPCSVLVVKEEKVPDTVVCCLDHDQVSQDSLEMINQLVTVHDASLKIVGLAGPKGLRDKVEKKMNEILRYYTARDVQALVKLVGDEDLQSFAAEAARQGLVGLWYGQNSLLKKIFSKDRLEQLITNADFSVLVLK